LRDRSSRPLHSPRRTSSELTAQVIALRRQLRPAYQIAQATGLSARPPSAGFLRGFISTAGAISILPHPSCVMNIPHLAICSTSTSKARYQQVSIRGDGRRRGRPQFAGWQALHVAIDDHSRLAFSRMLPNQQSETAIAFLHAAVAFYASTASPSAACSPTTAPATAPASFALPACSSASSTASPGLTLPAPTARPNASFKPLCASGLTSATTSTQKNEISSSRLGSITTTSTVRMVVSATLRPSAAPLRWVQRLERSQVPNPCRAFLRHGGEFDFSRLSHQTRRIC
jgi:hypothetical protein